MSLMVNLKMLVLTIKLLGLLGLFGTQVLRVILRVEQSDIVNLLSDRDNINELLNCISIILENYTPRSTKLTICY